MNRIYPIFGGDIHTELVIKLKAEVNATILIASWDHNTLPTHRATGKKILNLTQLFSDHDPWLIRTFRPIFIKLTGREERQSSEC